MIPWFLVLTGCERVLDLESPPPEVCVPAEAEGFVLPSPRWGLAAAYVARRLHRPRVPGPALPASWFLASAWQATDFGCAVYPAPFEGLAAPYDTEEGCLAIHQDLQWLELCRLYPDTFACEDRNAQVSGDQPEAGAVALAWFAQAAYAMGERLDPSLHTWITEGADDPAAMAAMAAAFHRRGPFYQADPLLQACDDDVVACMDDDLAGYVGGVLDKQARLDAASCDDTPVPVDDVQAFVEGLQGVLPSFDGAAAARAALAGDRTPRTVIEAIEAAAPVRLDCPEAELWQWYRLPCP